MSQRDRHACLQMADEWVRLAQINQANANAAPESSRVRVMCLANAYAFDMCAAELRELMEPVRRG